MVVKHLAMHVRVAVSPMGVDRFIMVMLVMPVMHVAVIVLEGIVQVLVLVALGKVQPYSDTHEDGAGEEIGADFLAENQNRNERTDKGSEREVRSCSGGAEMPQGENKKHQTDTVTDKPHTGGGQQGQRAGSTGAARQRDGRIDNARDKSFGGGNFNRISLRNLPR